ncbi:MAG: PAS domain S-box protein [Bacteroidota bacterium]
MRLTADRRARLLERLAILSASHPTAKGVRLLLSAVASETGCSYCSLVRVDGEDTRLVFSRESRSGVSGPKADDAVRPLARAVIRNGSPVMRARIAQSAASRSFTEAGLAAVSVVPVRLRRSTVGALCIGSTSPFHEPAATLKLVRIVAAHAATLLDRAGTDEKLHGALEKYNTLFRGVIDAVFLVDPRDGAIIDVNPQALRLTGRRRNELIGSSIFDLHAEDYQASAHAAFERVRTAKWVAQIGPVDYVRKNGKRVPTEMTASLVSLGDRNVIVAILRDLSEQKRAEVKLAASEELLRIIVEGTLDMFFYVHDVKGIFTYISPSVERITGHTAAFWKDHYTKSLTDSPINLQVREYTERAMREGIAAPAYLCEVYHADGRRLLLEINEKPVFKEGKVIGVQGVARDITERKRLEEAILESRDTLNRILNQTPLAVMVLDPRGNLVDVNEAWLRLFGAPGKEAVVGRVNVFHARVFKKSGLSDNVAAAYKGQIVDIPSVVIDPRSASPDLQLTGAERTVHARMFPVTGGNAMLTNVVGMLEDVTDRRRLEEQLIQSQKMESIGLLAGGIAHDFNNILGGILGYASFVKSQVPKEDKIFPHLETIERSALRAAELTSQLLAFARGGKYVVGPMAINDLIGETVELLRGSIEKNIQLQASLDPSSPVIEADASQMQQVLMNLCINARDAMPGGGTLTIGTQRLDRPDAFLQTVLDARWGPYVKIDIADTGVGIDRTIRGKIFDPFFTTKEKGKGTGLGLATVYGIVKNHGGFINVESEVGVGTTFSVYIPAVEKAAERAAATESGPTRGRETILIVDDEETIRTLVSDILQDKGYAVVGAGDGRAAVEIYNERGREIDLVILDMTMPGMGGPETFDKLKSMNPDVRVILSTGYSQDERARDLLARGVKAFVQKPYRIDDLAVAVRRVLDAPPA